jgi:hypothetical protein
MGYHDPAVLAGDARVGLNFSPSSKHNGRTLQPVGEVTLGTTTD